MISIRGYLVGVAVLMLSWCPKLLTLNRGYIIAPSGIGDRLFDPQISRDGSHIPFIELKSKLAVLGYALLTADINDDLRNAQFIIVSDICLRTNVALEKYRDKSIIAIVWEPHIIQPEAYDRRHSAIYRAIHIMDDRFVDGYKYKKLYYPQPSLQMIEKPVPFNEKKFCTFVASYKSVGRVPGELYSERLRAINFFESQSANFEFYGAGWPIGAYKTYHGPIVRKSDVLKNYKFCICFENTGDQPGYITEKIFDCFVAGCVPVYLGAPNIGKYIPPSCFVDFRKFSGNYEQLR